MKRISRGLLCAFAATMILLLAAGAPALAAAKIIYVDSSGNDTSGTGEKDAPFATIEKAFDYAKDEQEHARRREYYGRDAGHERRH